MKKGCICSLKTTCIIEFSCPFCKYLVFELIASMNEEESDKTTLKTENRNRNEENRRQIIDFIADNGISDSKSIAKAIGLKSSRTRDYLKQLVDEGILEVEGEYKNRKYRIKK